MTPGSDSITARPDALPAGRTPPAWEPRRRLERELQRLDEALAGATADTELQFMRANVLLALGRGLEARAAYLEILGRDPDHLGTLFNLARHLSDSRLSSAARTVLERAVRLHPRDPRCKVNLATLLYQADQLPAARTLYEQALELAPDHGAAHAGLSFVLGRLGDADGAARHRRRGFAGRAVIALPYRGTGAPIPVLLLASANGANAPVERFLDDRTFQTWIVVPEFLAATAALPPHQLVFNAIGDVDAAPAAVEAARRLLAHTAAPVINRPSAVAASGRCANWQRLGALPDVIAPRAATLPRAVLAAPDSAVALQRHGLAFPLLLRSPGFHTGEHFVRVDEPAGLAAALAALPGPELIAMQFLDTRDRDGMTRKYRVMFVGTELHPLHLAISRHWKVHYFSADMAEHAGHRAEEERFLRDMAGCLGRRAMAALERIRELLDLDYGGIDFTLGPQGEVLVFEANATMVVYYPDADARWDYRRAAVAAVDAAVRRMLLARAAPPPALERRAPRAPARAPVAGPPAPLANDLNFSGGPGALPEEVLLQVQQAVIALPETGLSVLGMSHRSAWFEELLAEAQDNLRGLLAIPDTHAVLFLQGGSSLQFSMIPMNFAAPPGPAPAHVQSGYWSAKAIQEAQCVRPLEVAWSGADGGYRRLPGAAELRLDAAAPYLHYVSNETVEGLQFKAPPESAGIALIADMSSDFLSRPVDFSRHAMVYAHAQKNLGPAGVTVVVIDHRLFDTIPRGLPPMLDYRTHLQHRSNYNTPPVFGIYVMTLVTRWLRDGVGGMDALARINAAKAHALYGTLDRLAEVLQAHADVPFRSEMNASFRFRDERLDAQFIGAAGHAGFSGLAGHRSIGGIRASLYNAVGRAAVDQLCSFLEDFCARRA